MVASPSTSALKGNHLDPLYLRVRVSAEVARASFDCEQMKREYSNAELD